MASVNKRSVHPAISSGPRFGRDRKSTRLNSSHGYISYAVFCLKKKNETHDVRDDDRVVTLGAAHDVARDEDDSRVQLLLQSAHELDSLRPKRDHDRRPRLVALA